MDFGLYEEKQCRHCDDNKYRLNEVAHFMEEVLKQLYIKENPVNEDILDHCLSEMCYYLNVKLPTQTLQVVRKIRMTDYLSEWKNQNNNFLNTLVKKEG